MARHFHYLPEISAAFFWTVPALFSHVSHRKYYFLLFGPGDPARTNMKLPIHGTKMKFGFISLSLISNIDSLLLLIICTVVPRNDG